MGDLRAAVLTVSDGVARGDRDDRSGPAIVGTLRAAGFDVVRTETVPDDRAEIARAIGTLAGVARVVVTTGGTGLGRRDVTPEATRDVIDREVPGLAEAMRVAGRASTPVADLSRAVVGSAGSALVVNVPGSERAATESLDAIVEVIPHALDVLSGETAHEVGGHR